MPRSRTTGTSQSSEQTRARLLAAAGKVLAEHGYAGATARAIGEAADCNQALIFYHYGSVQDLLLAALDASSSARLEQYRHTLGRVGSTRELLGALGRLYQDDRQTGHVTVLAQMVAGGLSDPALGAAVAERVQPWVTLTRDTITTTIPATLRRRLPLDELAYAIVAFTLGLEILSVLARDHARADAVVRKLTGGGSRLIQLWTGTKG